MPALPQAQHRSVMPAADPPVPPLRYKSSQREEKAESQNDNGASPASPFTPPAKIRKLRSIVWSAFHCRQYQRATCGT